MIEPKDIANESSTRAAKKLKGIRLAEDAERAIKMHQEAISRKLFEDKTSFAQEIKSAISGQKLKTLRDLQMGLVIEKDDEGFWRYQKINKNVIYDHIDQLAVFDYVDRIGSTGEDNIVIVSWRERMDRALKTPVEIIAAAEMIEKKAETQLLTGQRLRKLALDWEKHHAAKRRVDTEAVTV